ncbi:MAG: DUF1801 domain-containing protein [Pirellulaceae bacterium]
MAELKTKQNDASVAEFLAGVEEEQRRADCHAVLKIMQEATGEPAKMWGASIIGFGSYRYKYASGREGDWMLIGFSPRKRDLTLYIMAGFDGYGELMAKLGKYKTGKSCLYIKKLEDIHLPTLKKLIKQSARHVKKTQSGC